MASEWDLKRSSKIIFSLGNFNGHEMKEVEGFEGEHGGMELGRKM